MQLINLKTKYLGRYVNYYKEIDSTQDEIWRLVENNKIKDGNIVITEIQTKGKGTHGRIWYTDEIGNIAFSLFKKTNCRINCLEGITLVIARTIVNIFKENYGIQLQIKKPNDIVLNKKKIGGILTQIRTEGEKAKFIVIGIGINTKKEKFTKDIEEIATSIKKEFNIKIETSEFISEFCNRFEEEINKRIGD